MIASYAYDPYGNTTSSSGTGSSPFRYANYLFDNETQLYKVGARYLDPSVGRWTQRDPIDSPLDERGWNRYVYAGNDPINVIDPTGLVGCSYVPDRVVSIYSWRDVCNAHDWCYSPQSRTNRRTCDLRFLKGTQAKCEDAFFKSVCIWWSLEAWLGIRTGGWIKYDGRGLNN